MEVVQSIGAPLFAGFRELMLQEVEKRSCMIDRGLGILPQPPALVRNFSFFKTYIVNISATVQIRI